MMVEIEMPSVAKVEAAVGLDEEVSDTDGEEPPEVSGRIELE